MHYEACGTPPARPKTPGGSGYRQDNHWRGKMLGECLVKGNWQGRGIGPAIQKCLEGYVDIPSRYCLPFRHLAKFYAKIGFEKITAAGASLPFKRV